MSDEKKVGLVNENLPKAPSPRGVWPRRFAILALAAAYFSVAVCVCVPGLRVQGDAHPGPRFQGRFDPPELLVAHGWPWTFLTRPADDADVAELQYSRTLTNATVYERWSVDQGPPWQNPHSWRFARWDQRWNRGAAIADAAVVLLGFVVLLGIGKFCLRRRARRRRQFSLGAMLLLMTAASVAFALWAPYRNGQRYDDEVVSRLMEQWAGERRIRLQGPDGSQLNVGIRFRLTGLQPIEVNPTIHRDYGGPGIFARLFGSRWFGISRCRELHVTPAAFAGDSPLTAEDIARLEGLRAISFRDQDAAGAVRAREILAAPRGPREIGLGSGFTPADIRALAARSPRRIDLTGFPLNADVLNALATLPSLREAVGLDGGMTDQLLPLLANLSAVESLEINASELTGSTIAELRRLPNLHTLRLMYFLREGGDLSGLGELKGLRRLIISGTQIRDEHISALANLDQLESLVLLGWNLNGETLDVLQGLSRLKSLHVRSSTMTRGGVAAIGKLKSLRRLVLTGIENAIPVSPDNLAGLDQLESLVLERVLLAEGAWKNRSLRSVAVAATQGSQPAVAGLEALPALETLVAIDPSGEVAVSRR